MSAPSMILKQLHLHQSLALFEKYDTYEDLRSGLKGDRRSTRNDFVKSVKAQNGMTRIL